MKKGKTDSMKSNCCRICGSPYKKTDIFFEDTPLMQSTLCKTKTEAFDFPCGNIDIGICENCGAIFNSEFDNNKISYSENYDNSQSYSAFFVEHMDKILKLIMDNVDHEIEHILEIGCGKGAFLRLLYEKTGVVCAGYDPSYVGEAYPTSDHNLCFIKENFYGQNEYLNDIVIMRHVIEHVQNPVEMFNLVYSALAEDGIFYIETPALEWILENNVLFDFTYEHCSYYTAYTLGLLLSRAGFVVKNLEYSFNGQYLSVIAQKASLQLNILKMRLQKFEVEKSIKVEAVREFIKKINESGKTAFWGAAGKGVECCIMFDRDCRLISCVVDINPNKCGCFIPVTGHPIISPKELISNAIKNIIVLNSNYHTEIVALLKQLCISDNVYCLDTMLKENQF